MALIRISPDGKEVVHLYGDKIADLTRKTTDIEINRASNIFFDNDIKRWRIAVKGGNLLPASFKDRSLALVYEKMILENKLRDGEEVCAWKTL